MTPKEKYQDIDASASVLPEKAIINLKQLKPILFDKKYQTQEYSDTRKKAEEKMNALYDKIAKDYPDAIKSKVAKQPEPKTPQAMAQKAAKQTIKQPTVKNPKATAGANNRGNVTKLAKTIRKEGETWHAAMKRAGEMINKEKGKAVKKANVQYEKLKAFLAKNPSIEKTMVTYGKKPNQGTRPLDVKRDAARIAKPKGKRISADGKTYYEYRANRTDSSRKRYPYLELGGKLFGAGYFAKGGNTKSTGMGWIEPQRNINSTELFDLNYGDVFQITKKDHTASSEYYIFLELSDKHNVSIKAIPFPALKGEFGNKETYINGVSDGDIRILSREEAGKMLLEYDINNKKFANGGEFGHTFNGAGHFAKGGYIAEGENYEYVNTFGIPQADFNMLVDVWHKNEKTQTAQTFRELVVTTFSMDKKYGEENVNKILDYIEETHSAHEHGGMGHSHNLPNTVEEYFAAMNDFSMKLGEAEANFANDNGASYQKLLAERDEFFEKVKAKWYAELNEAEGNFAKDGGKSYEAALKKLEDARIRFAKGGKTKSKTFKVKIYSTDYHNTLIMEKTFTNEKAAVDYAYSVDDMNDDGFYYNIYGFDANGKKLIKVYGVYEYVDDDSDEVADEDYIKKHPKYKDCVSWQVDMRVASYPTNKTIMTKTFDTLRKAVKLVDKLEGEPLSASINNIYYEDFDNDEYAKGGKTKSYSKYVVRKDLLDENTGVPVGDTYVSDGVYEGRYNDDGTFEIKMNGKWQEAESVDWEKYAKGGGIRHDELGGGKYKYGIFTVSEDGKELGHIFYSDNPDLEFDPYGDDVPVSVGSNQMVRRLDEYAKGGKVKGRLSDTHKYVPNRMIQEIEVERRGKTTFIDGADILDGVYVKKGVKFAHGGTMPHIHSKKHRNG